MSQDDPTSDSLYKDRWTVSADADGASSADNQEPPLPMVEPPSAGFIVQLFVVPAVIVSVVIGVYLLFGQLAAGEADWRQLVTDVRSENTHLRWRSALTLAQVLQDDALRKDKGQQLASNPEVATALTEMLSELLKTANPNEEQTQQTEFMLKAVGLLDVPATSLPLLLSASEDNRDRDLRKEALNSLAQVCGRAFEAGKPLSDSTLVNRVIAVTKDNDPLFRHQSTFILGMLSSSDAESRLGDLLEDPDLMTQLHAAIGFARQKSPRGLPVVESVFDSAVDWSLNPALAKTPEQAGQYYEHALLVKNSLHVVQDLAPQLDAPTRQRLREKIAKFADKAEDIAIQSQWMDTRQALDKAL